LGISVRALVMATSVITAVSSIGAAAPASAASPDPLAPHAVPISTQTVDAEDYLLKYGLNERSGAFDVDLKVGSGLRLDTDAQGALLVQTEEGELRDRLDLPALAGEQLSVSRWTLVSDTEAEASITQSAIDTATSAAGQAEERIRGPKKAWYDCMSSHGVSGALAGAAAGCATTIAIGCVEGAVTGGTVGMIGSIVAALWTCRGKY
jgi:hypothetical protein